MEWFDSLLMQLYRITGDPVSGFFVGTFLLAVIASALGEATTILLFRSNRGFYERLHGELVEHHDESVAAISRGDSYAFSHHHRKANSAFAITFFSQIALVIGSLWPVFFVLAFLQGHFALLTFPIPGTSWTINYMMIFLIEYALARMVLNPLKYWIPGVARMKEILEDARAKAAELSTLTEDVPESATSERLPAAPEPEAGSKDTTSDDSNEAGPSDPRREE